MTDSLERLKRYDDYFSRLREKLKLTFGVNLPSIINSQALADSAFEELARCIGQSCRAEDRDKIENMGRQLRSLDCQLNSQILLCQGLISRVGDMELQRTSLDRLQTKLTQAFGVLLPYSIAEQPLSDNVLEELVASISRSYDRKKAVEAQHSEQKLQSMEQRLDRSQSFASELREQLGTVRGQLDYVQSTNELLRNEIVRLEMETSRHNLFQKSMRDYRQLKGQIQPRRSYAIKTTETKGRQIDREKAGPRRTAAAVRQQVSYDTDSKSESDLGSQVESESCSQCQFDPIGPRSEQPQDVAHTRRDARGFSNYRSSMADVSHVASRYSQSRVGEARVPSPASYSITLDGQQYQIVGISKKSRSSVVTNVTIARRFNNETRTEEISCSIPLIFYQGTVDEAIRNCDTLYNYCSSQSTGLHTNPLHPSIMFQRIEQKKRTAKGCSFKVRYRNGATSRVAASKLIKWGQHVATQMRDEYSSKCKRD